MESPVLRLRLSAGWQPFAQRRADCFGPFVFRRGRRFRSVGAVFYCAGPPGRLRMRWDISSTHLAYSVQRAGMSA